MLNTGLVGGPQGVGQRISIAHTRAIVRAVVEGRLRDVPTRRDPIFGVHVPSAVPDVPADVLNPRSAWLDPDEYDRRALPLKAVFAATSAALARQPPWQASGGQSSWPVWVRSESECSD